MTSCGVFPSGIFPIKLLSIWFRHKGYYSCSSSNGLVDVYKRYQYMINRRKCNTLSCTSVTTYHLLCMGPKSFSAVMVRKTTAQSERHTKRNASLVFHGDFSRFFCRLENHRNANTSSGSKNKDILNSLSQLPTINS